MELDTSMQNSDTLSELKRNLLERDEQIEELKSKLTWFQEQFRLLKHHHYGTSSEKQSTLQAELFDEDEWTYQIDHTEDAHKEKITYERRKPSNRPDKHLDTSHLPRETQTIDLKDDEKHCACGHDLEHFGEERKEELVWIPATLKVIEHIRLKYTCRKCETVRMPAAVETPLSKSKASASLLAEIILNKYSYHLPFYRQSKILVSSGLRIPSHTLAGWVMQAAKRLMPLSNALWSALSSAQALQADETPVKVLVPEKKAYMWLYHSYLPNTRFVVFDFSLSRGSDVVNARLKDFKGILQTDGYSGYNGQRERSDIISIGCWDHARRKFTDVVKASSHNKTGKAGKMLKKIAKLYDIEATIRTQPFDERRRIRQEQSKPLLESIHSFLYKINAPPKSLLGIAVTYCKNQWDDLARYVDYGNAELSNCWIENQVRPFALGRRNWLFVGNEGSAAKAALLYSLIQSCELNQIDARAYLEYVLGQVHHMRRNEVDPATLLPHTINPKLLEKSELDGV